MMHVSLALSPVVLLAHCTDDQFCIKMCMRRRTECRWYDMYIITLYIIWWRVQATLINHLRRKWNTAADKTAQSQLRNHRSRTAITIITYHYFNRFEDRIWVNLHNNILYCYYFCDITRPWFEISFGGDGTRCIIMYIR